MLAYENSTTDMAIRSVDFLRRVYREARDSGGPEDTVVMVSRIDPLSTMPGSDHRSLDLAMILGECEDRGLPPIRAFARSRANAIDFAVKVGLLGSIAADLASEEWNAPDSFVAIVWNEVRAGSSRLDLIGIPIEGPISGVSKAE